MIQNTASAKLGKPIPQCKAFLLCERAIREAGTGTGIGRASLIGIVHKVDVPSLPAQLPPLSIYLLLVEGIGRYHFTAEVWDLATGQCLIRGQGVTLEFKDRLGFLEVIMPLPPLLIAQESILDVVVFADGQEIQRQKFRVACAASDGPG